MERNETEALGFFWLCSRSPMRFLPFFFFSYTQKKNNISKGFGRL